MRRYISTLILYSTVQWGEQLVIGHDFNCIFTRLFQNKPRIHARLHSLKSIIASV